MLQPVALGLTIAVELPWYVVGLTALRLTSPWRAALLGVGVNLLTHPALWWLLPPQPTLTGLIVAELGVGAVETVFLIAWVRREPALLAVLSIGANATSLLIGLLLT